MGNVSTKSVSVAKSSYVPIQDINASPVVQAIQTGNIFSALPLELMHEILGRIAQGEPATVGAFARASHVTSNGAGKRLLTERILHMVEVSRGKQAQLSQVQRAIQLLTNAGDRRDPEQAMLQFKKIINYVQYLAPKDRLLAEKTVLDALLLVAPRDRSELLFLMVKPYSNDWNPDNSMATSPQHVETELMLVLDKCAELPVELRLPILLAICKSPGRHLVLGQVLEQARALPKAEKTQVLAGLYFRMFWPSYGRQDLRYPQAILKDTLDLAGADLALVFDELIPTLRWSADDCRTGALLDQILGQLQTLPHACAAPLIVEFVKVNKGVTDKAVADRRSNALRAMIAGFPDALVKAHGFANLTF